jgi:hypothetical protein
VIGDTVLRKVSKDMKPEEIPVGSTAIENLI